LSGRGQGRTFTLKRSRELSFLQMEISTCEVDLLLSEGDRIDIARTSKSINLQTDKDQTAAEALLLPRVSCLLPFTFTDLSPLASGHRSNAPPAGFVAWAAKRSSECKLTLFLHFAVSVWLRIQTRNHTRYRDFVSPLRLPILAPRASMHEKGASQGSSSIRGKRARARREQGRRNSPGNR